MLAPIFNFIRSPILKFLPNEKSDVKKPGPRYWLRICVGKKLKPLALVNCAELKHWLFPFTHCCCAGPRGCAGVAVPPFWIAVVPSTTVKGNPLRAMKFSEKIQFPNKMLANRLLKWYGSVHT